MEKKFEVGDSDAGLYVVDSFIKSSHLVRYSIITITIASILLFVGHHNSESDSWFNSRLRLAYTALHEKVWTYPAGKLSGELELARRWAEARNLKSAPEIEEHIKTLEDARTSRLLLVQIPFFSVSHDVNDLGFFGSIALLILMLMLTFAMARQHENLYLALWRVRRLFDDEKRIESARNHSNLIYHTLAMSQQFSQPPTLARWKMSKLRGLSRLLLPFPLVVQAFCFNRDWTTRDLGRIVNPYATNLSLTMQGIALIVVSGMTVACFLYTRSNDLRWKDTFERINPSYKEQLQPSWLEWVQVLKPEDRYCSQNHSHGLAAAKHKPEP
ncbi:MAG TPA: hypothetical protein VLR69_00220 [Thermoanaerobaculia bacterium]|nr:hypothetical protein [Thermoanaerobaculia bacterium]